MENRRSQWYNLRAELLELILEKLDLVDHARFAPVCSSWRSVAVNNPPINKPLSFVLSHDPLNLVRRFITSFTPYWKEATFIGAAVDGWLVVLIDGLKLFLLNKGFNTIIPLPPPTKHPKNYFKIPVFFKAVLSSPPRLSSSSSSSYECTVVIKIFNSGVFYYRLGSDKSFTKLSSVPPWPEDILFYKEQLFVLCCRKIFIIKFDHLLNKVVSQSQMLTHLADSPTPRRFLISGNNNNILSIVAGLPSRYSVFTLEGSEPKRLVRVNNIGEDDNFQFQTLLSNDYCSLSITTKEHKEFRRPTNYFNNDFSTLVLETSEDPNKAKAGDPWPLFFVMFSYHGIKNLGPIALSKKKKKKKQKL